VETTGQANHSPLLLRNCNNCDSPIPRRGLYNRKRRRCGGIGPQNAWTKADRDGLFHRCKFLAFLRLKTALGADYNCERPGRRFIARQGAQDFDGIARRCIFITMDQRAILRPITDQSVEYLRLLHSGKGQDAALFGRFDNVGPHPVEIDPRGLGAARDDGPQTPCTHLDRLLDHVVQARVFERRKHEVEIVGRGLGADLSGNLQMHGFSSLDNEFGQPFAVAAVENQDLCSGSQAQHVAQVIDVLPRSGNIRAGFQICIEV